MTNKVTKQRTRATCYVPARVVMETLSDDSNVFNVVYDGIIIAASDSLAAERIAAVLNDCAVWAQQK
jgi:hypothetical protein